VAKIARALDREPLRIVMPDLIGLGLSDKPWSPRFHTLENHAEHVGALCDELGLSGVILGVQDWGGPIGLLAFADAKRKKTLAGLVVLNTAVGPPRPDSRPRNFIASRGCRSFPNSPSVCWISAELARLRAGRSRFDQGDVSRAYRWPLRRITENAAPLALARMVPDSVAHESVAGLVRCAA